MPSIQHKYGIVAPVQLTPFQVELVCFKKNLQPENGGLGAYQHFRNAVKIACPKIVWNEWLERMIMALCDPNAGRLNPVTREIIFSGCGAAGKTFAVGLFSFFWWLADINNSNVHLTSTTAKSVGLRIWPVIQDLYRWAGESLGPAGNLVDSEKCLQASRGDKKHAIFAKAVGEGNPHKAAANIQGVHLPRMLVMLDEATEVQPAILIALQNLEKGARDLIVVKVGNPLSRFDCLGQSMEPAGGWSSVTVDSEEWTCKSGALCLHFDGHKSPNVKAGKTIHPKIYTWENYLADQRKDQNTIEYWMYVRGFPPDDSVSNAVTSEALILKHRARENVTFSHSTRMLAGLDPAFGGDKCILFLAEMGEIAGDVVTGKGGDGKIGIQLLETMEISVNATDTTPRDYQIARQVIAECKSRGVAPECFGSDATGIGRGVFAIIFEEWSSKIIRVEFGGKASDLPASTDDPRPSHEVYDRRVTELWFSIRQFVVAEQIYGMTVALIRQLSNRRYQMVNRKNAIETKEIFKSRHGHSPDEADALSVVIEVARRLGALATSGGVQRDQKEWAALARTAGSLHGPDEGERERDGMPVSQSWNQKPLSSPNFGYPFTEGDYD